MAIKHSVSDFHPHKAIYSIMSVSPFIPLDYFTGFPAKFLQQHSMIYTDSEKPLNLTTQKPELHQDLPLDLSIKSHKPKHSDSSSENGSVELSREPVRKVWRDILHNSFQQRRANHVARKLSERKSDWMIGKYWVISKK